MKKVLQIVLNAVEKADRRVKNQIAQELEDYAEKYRRTFNGIGKLPFFSDFLCDLIELTDARIK